MKKILKHFRKNWIRYGFETLVVIAGILVAFSLNNWNERRKDKILERSYLERMKLDLISDTVYLQQRIQLSQSELEIFNAFVKQSYEIQSNLEEYLQLIDPLVWNAENLILQDKTIQELTNSGRLDLISSSNLKNMILSYYKLYNTSSAHIAEMNQSSLNMIQHAGRSIFNVKHFVKDMFNEDVIVQNTEWEYINEPRSTKFREFENVVAYYSAKHKFFLNHYDSLLKACNELILEIENVLNEKQ